MTSAVVRVNLANGLAEWRGVPIAQVGDNEDLRRWFDHSYIPQSVSFGSDVHPDTAIVGLMYISGAPVHALVQVNLQNGVAYLKAAPNGVTAPGSELRSWFDAGWVAECIARGPSSRNDQALVVLKQFPAKSALLDVDMGVKNGTAYLKAGPQPPGPHLVDWLRSNWEIQDVAQGVGSWCLVALRHW